MFDQMEKQMPEIIWQALSEMKEIKELLRRSNSICVVK